MSRGVSPMTSVRSRGQAAGARARAIAGSSERSSSSEPKPPWPRSKWMAEAGAGELQPRDGLEVAGHQRQAHAVACAQLVEHAPCPANVRAEVGRAQPRVGLGGGDAESLGPASKRAASTSARSADLAGDLQVGLARRLDGAPAARRRRRRAASASWTAAAVGIEAFSSSVPSMSKSSSISAGARAGRASARRPARARRGRPGGRIAASSASAAPSASS